MTPIRCFMLEPTAREVSEDGVTTPVYRRADTGEEMTWWAAPVGAMMYADLWECNFRGPDGHVLVVKVPSEADGSGSTTWVIDGPSRDHGAGTWQRTGTPPNVTANPSIFINPPNGFHGWLRDGEIIKA
jgi:hypothetical protein